MENFLSALAFAGLIAAQFLSVVLINTQRCEDPPPDARAAGPHRSSDLAAGRLGAIAARAPTQARPLPANFGPAG
jgi:hypothetical protein